MKIIAETEWIKIFNRTGMQRSFLASDNRQHTFYWDYPILVESREQIKLDAETAYRKWQYEILYAKSPVRSWIESTLIFLGMIATSFIVMSIVIWVQKLSTHI